MKTTKFELLDNRSKDIFAQFLWTILLMVLTYTILVFSYHFNEINWNYPLNYTGDTLAVLQKIQLMLNGEWPIYGIPKSSQLGAPFGFELGDFSSPNTAQNLFLKGFTLFSDNIFIIYNSYVISSYFLCAIGMFYVLLKLTITPIIAIGVSLLFSFLPFHYFRIPHFDYIHYFYLPLFLYFVMKIWDEVPLFYTKEKGSVKLKYSPQNIMILFFVAFFAVWNFYYSFFICYFICLATISSYLVHKSMKHVMSGLIILTTIISSFVVSYLPFKYFQYVNGVNLTVANRSPEESKIYAMRISDLFSPVEGHRLAIFEKLPDFFFANSGALGAAGVIGFIYGIMILISKVDTKNLQSRYAIMLIAGVLLFTYSGFSYLFALYVTPSIRGYSRGVVFIALFSLVLLSILLNKIYLYTSSSYRRWILAVAILFFVIGIWDISSTRMNFAANRQTQETIDAQRALVFAISKKLSTHQSPKVLQLPYMSYPESVPIHNMDDYSYAFVNYFNRDESIKWTGGAIRGRKSDIWIKELLSFDIETQLSILRESGFNGILIDRFGYDDGAKRLINNLQLVIPQKCIKDRTNRYLFFYFDAKETSDIVLLPNFLYSNFWGWEGGRGKFSWAKGDAILHLPNDSKKTINYRLEFSLTTILPRDVEFTIVDIHYKYHLNSGQLKTISQVIDIPPGGIYIAINTDKPAKRPNNKDLRKLSFAIANLKLITDRVNIVKKPYRR